MSSGPLIPLLRSDESTLYRRLRKEAHQLVEGSIDTYFEYTLLFVIFSNVVLLIVSTIVVDDDPEWYDSLGRVGRFLLQYNALV